jgi:hypothetical protein
MEALRRGRRLAGAGVLLAALAAPAAGAGAASGVFSVNIRLNGPQPDAQEDVCISESLSAQTNALVQVVCTDGPFVRIAPNPAKPFLGVHGGAFRYHFSPFHEVGAPASLSGDDLMYIGAGTVTALRIYDPGGEAGLLELEVSF